MIPKTQKDTVETETNTQYIHDTYTSHIRKRRFKKDERRFSLF